MSDSSLSSNDDSPVVFQGFSLYSTAEDEDCAYDGDDAAPAAPCEVRPDSTRSFNDRVEELLRRRVAECAASSPVTKRRRLFGHLGASPRRPTPVTPGGGGGGGVFRERVVSCDDFDADSRISLPLSNAPSERSSSSLSQMSVTSAALDDEPGKMTPHSRTNSYSKLVTPFDLDGPEAPPDPRVAAYEAAEALLTVQTH